jgi:hypothetical protein
MQKRFTTIIFTMLLATTAFYGQEPAPIALQRAEKNLIIALNSDNYGLQQSALAVCLEMKLNYPEYVFAELREALEECAQTDKDADVRKKAGLIALFFIETDYAENR